MVVVVVVVIVLLVVVVVVICYGEVEIHTREKRRRMEVISSETKCMYVHH